jgi:MAGUK p55 subfamily protein 5
MTLNSSIFAGSPAEKADLEVADEILEVNGESLENSNHTDVIAHIHNVRKPFVNTRLKRLFIWKATSLTI